MKYFQIDELIKILQTLKNNPSVEVKASEGIEEAIECFDCENVQVVRRVDFSIIYKQPITVSKETFNFMIKNQN